MPTRKGVEGDGGAESMAAEMQDIAAFLGRRGRVADGSKSSPE